MPIIDEKKAKEVSDSFKSMSYGGSEKKDDMPKEKDKDKSQDVAVITMDSIKRRMGLL